MSKSFKKGNGSIVMHWSCFSKEVTHSLNLHNNKYWNCKEWADNNKLLQRTDLDRPNLGYYVDRQQNRTQKVVQEVVWLHEVST